jgi:NFU1 iron-sulfur cluster scaffold homolog, mitochondrial
METVTQNYITVYAEATPNPDAIKFVLNKELLPAGYSFDFPDMEKAQDSPLAAMLFKFSFVKGVYISQNFVTVNKHPDNMWAELIPIIRTFLKEYIQAGDPIISLKMQEEFAPAETEVHDENEVVSKIKEILTNSVKPVVEMDGGNIEFKSFDEGIVTVSLRGSCSGCPSSTITLKAGIENLLKRMVPEVKEVVAEAL